jgi:hypothetical protein
LMLPYVLAVFVVADLVGTGRQPEVSTFLFRRGG